MVRAVRWNTIQSNHELWFCGGFAAVSSPRIRGQAKAKQRTNQGRKSSRGAIGCAHGKSTWRPRPSGTAPANLRQRKAAENTQHTPTQTRIAQQAQGSVMAGITASQSRVSELNRSHMLRVLYRGGIKSRAQIAQELGLTPAADGWAPACRRLD